MSAGRRVIVREPRPHVRGYVRQEKTAEVRDKAQAGSEKKFSTCLLTAPPPPGQTAVSDEDFQRYQDSREKLRDSAAGRTAGGQDHRDRGQRNARVRHLEIFPIGRRGNRPSDPGDPYRFMGGKTKKRKVKVSEAR
jgi:hypothetical protein